MIAAPRAGVPPRTWPLISAVAAFPVSVAVPVPIALPLPVPVPLAAPLAVPVPFAFALPVRVPLERRWTLRRGRGWGCNRRNRTHELVEKRGRLRPCAELSLEVLLEALLVALVVEDHAVLLEALVDTGALEASLIMLLRTYTDYEYIEIMDFKTIRTYAVYRP